MSGLTIPTEALLTVCILTEAIIQVVKTSSPRELSATGINIISMVVGILLCLVMEISIFTGSTAVVYLGSVLAGLVVSRGSNFVHSTIDALMEVKTK